MHKILKIELLNSCARLVEFVSDFNVLKYILFNQKPFQFYDNFED